MANTNFRPIFCQQVGFNNTTTGGAVVDVKGSQTLVLRSTADVYVDFDQPVASTQSYLISASNTADTTITVPGGNISNLYVRGASGSGTLYIICITN